MRYILLFIAVLFVASANGQFVVKGTLSGYDNSQYWVKVIQDVNPIVVVKGTTDQLGKLEIEVPFTYKGLIYVETALGGVVELLADNSDIQFSATIQGREVSNLVVQDRVNVLFKEYKDLQEFENIQNKVFPVLRAKYNKGDAFGDAIEREDKRISNVLAEFRENSKSSEFLSYYLNNSRRLNEWSKVRGSASPDEVKKELTNGNDFLEKGRQIEAFLVKYFETISLNASSQEEFQQNILSGMGELLNTEGLNKDRKKNLLIAGINVLKADQFPVINSNLVEQLSVMSIQDSPDVDFALRSLNIAKGKVAPDFNFATQNGVNSLHGIKAKKKLLVFWASWCPACVSEMPFVEEFYNDFKAEGGEIVAISLDYNEDDFNEAIKDYKWINHSDLMKWDGPTGRKFGINSTPTLMLLDENNTILKIANSLGEILE